MSKRKNTMGLIGKGDKDDQPSKKINLGETKTISNFEIVESKYENLLGNIINDRYQIINIISITSINVILLALDLKNKSTIILKKIKENGLNKEYFTTAQSEINISKEIKNIKNYQDFFIVPSVIELDYTYEVYLLLEKGDFTIEELFVNKSFNYFKHRSFLIEMMEPVVLLHQQNIIHNDVKGSNFIFHKGKFKLIDFNAAVEKGFNIQQEVVGTPGLIAPEYYNTPRIIDEKVDVWSLCITFIILLTGVNPFDSGSETDKEIQENVLNKNYEIPSHFPNDIKGFLIEGIQKNPEKRPTLELLILKYFKSDFSKDLIEKIQARNLTKK